MDTNTVMPQEAYHPRAPPSLYTTKKAFIGKKLFGFNNNDAQNS